MNEQLLAFFKAMGDPNRLKIVGLLAEAPLSVEQLAGTLNLRPSTVSHHLAQLAAAGLVSARAESYYNIYELNPEAMEEYAARLLRRESLPSMAGSADASAYDRKVVSDYLLPNGRLKIIPAQRKKLEAVLRHVVESFAPGVRYPEKQVNEILSRFHEDTATLRRELVGYRLMERAAGEYWRSEGETGPELPRGFRWRNEKMEENNVETILLEFFKTMSDANRIQVAGAIARQGLTASQIAEQLDIRTQDVLRHLQMLTYNGLVEEQDNRYRLNTSALESLSRKVLAGRRTRWSGEEFEGEAYDRKVLSDFLTPDGRLKAFPSQEKKLLAILRYLAPMFEPGKRYSERQVNEILASVNEDTASLRRYLVDYGLLGREGGVYWRS